MRQDYNQDDMPGMLHLKDFHCTMNYDPDSTELEWGIEWEEYFDGRHPG